MTWADDALAIEVRDSGPGGSPNGAGHGIVGMHERARLHGGELRAGPSADGFAVEARLPLPRASEPEPRRVSSRRSSPLRS